MKDEFKVGDYVAISPDLTFKYKWISGKVTGIEEHHNGTVIVAVDPATGEVFFGRADNFINLHMDEEGEWEENDEEDDEEEDSE